MKKWYENCREELRARGNKGFTLMEMLIVVAIIAVLIAIAIPVFTSQLEKSREASDAANIRAAYAEVTVAAIDNSATDVKKEVTLQQTQEKWQNATLKANLGKLFGTDSTDLDAVAQGKKATISWVASSGTEEGHAKIIISNS